jgi:hypothetical protein
MDFERVHLMSAPCLPRQKSTSPVMSRKSPGKIGKTGRSMKAKDALLHDEQVLKERRSGAFKNYTYRERDIGLVLRRFTEAVENTE